jgi:hypothetical protein
MQTKEQILELSYNRLANTNQSTPWNKVPTIYKTIALEAMELYASQRQGGMFPVSVTTLPTEEKVYYVICKDPITGIEYKNHCKFNLLPVYAKSHWDCDNVIMWYSEASPTSQPAQGASKLDLLKMETNFSEILEKETSESLNQWLADSNIPTGPQCTCENDQKGRALCPVCDKEEYNGIKKAFDAKKSKQPSPEPVAAQGVEKAAKEFGIREIPRNPQPYDMDFNLLTVYEESFKAGASFIQSQHPEESF